MTLVMTSWNGSVMVGHYDGAGTCDRGSSRNEGWWGSSASSYPFGELFNHHVAAKTCYVTQGFWNGLTEQEKTTCKRYGQGIVGSGYFEDYMKEYPWVCARFVPESILECFTSVCRSLRPDLVCEGVVCDPVCIGSDKYSQACITEGENAGECVFDQLIKANSPDCPGYDPCLGVECPDKCVDYDLYSQICENGICIRGVLIEADNREICNYDPCRGVVCEDECFGADKWRMECEEGECLPERVIEPNSPDCGYIPPDLCDGVVCEDVCDNTNLHEGVCEGGSCVRGRLIEADSPTCRYIPPQICNNGEMRGKITCEDGSIIHAEICENNAWIPTNATCPTGPTPDPEPDKTPWDMIILAGIVVVLYIFMTRG